MALRWGIVGAGKISHDFANAIGTLSDDEHVIVAVAARDLTRAQDFAQLHEIPKSYDSYEDLAKDADVEIVYIGAIHPHHLELGMLMLSNRKHVLVETPLCMNEKQARKLIKYAEQKKLFLMEAVWSRFLPCYQYLRKKIENGMLGDLEEVQISFGFDLQTVDRITKKSLGGGALLDLGIYAIQFSQWVFREPPKTITATGELNEDGCDMAVKADLIYSSGAKTLISISVKDVLDNTAIVKGTKGQITIKNFWCAETLIDIDGTEKTWLLPQAKHQSNYPNSVGFR
ncbi:unnamed protein product [Hermetia illucens]|uniref:Trans-1,2-dihydrobenzene-1,2-diol dehydrogenase n=2 Tax=Hermetia illucens TaxID=343691 RepID=A0A7R8URB1_HERIL|nr:unnamed protein product [Hermetia illucens]